MRDPSKKTKTYIQMRAEPDFKARFDAACEKRGWSIQVALERVLGGWLNLEEQKETAPQPDRAANIPKNEPDPTTKRGRLIDGPKSGGMIRGNRQERP